MSKNKIIWLVIIILLVLGSSAILAYKDKLLPTGGYIVVDGPMCEWCGGSCVNRKNVNTPKISCADVVPTPGYECVAENNVCITKSVNLQTE